MRAIESNVHRTCSVGRPARGAQNLHQPHAREPGTPAATCPAPPRIEATTVRAPGSPPLGVALQPMGRVARCAASRSPRDRDSLAPAGLPRLLDLEIPPWTNGSTAHRIGDCGSRTHHDARESALGRATHPRGVAQTRFDVSQRTVARLMPRRPKPPSQTWRTFLANHLADLVSVDFFVVPTATFRVLYVFVVLLHRRRQVAHFNVTDSPTAAGQRNKLSRPFPMTRRRAFSSAIEIAHTASTLADG